MLIKTTNIIDSYFSEELDDTYIKLYQERYLGKKIIYDPDLLPYNCKLDIWDILGRISKKDNLLISIGDEWTWGCGITKKLFEDYHNDDKMADCDWDRASREVKCYGSILSLQLNADWINYALPNGTNFYIIGRLAKALKTYSKQYKNIYVVLCLTETGREFTLSNPSVDNILHFDLDSVCQRTEQYIINMIYKIYGQRDLNNLAICRTFTYSYPDTKYHTSHLKPWIEINEQKSKIDNDFESMKIYGPGTIQTYNLMTMFPSADSELKQDKIANLNGYLANGKFTNFAGPTEKSHKFWANYLYRYFTGTI